MELLEQIVSIASNNCFAIVMCGLLFWKMNKQDEDHKEETGKLAIALENNTIAIQKLVDKLD